MEDSLFLSLIGHIGSLINFTFSSVDGLITRKRKEITKESLLPEGLSNKDNVDTYETPTRIFIPELFARWPWPRRVNPNYAIVKEEADTWMNNFKAYSPEAQDVCNRCDFNLLGCLAYPTANKDHLRSACDLMHVLFLIDEYTDRSTPSEVQEQKDIVTDALRNPYTPRPKGEWIGGEVTRQFWERTIQNATAISQKRFIQSMDEYLEEVVQESIDKEDQRILDVKTFVDARRRTSASKAVFALIELGLDIPDDVMSHPAMEDTILAAIDMVTFANDLLSYNLEQHRGDELHNMITCVMNEYHTDVNGAVLWVEDFILKAEARFCAAIEALPILEEPLNSQVKEYCDGLGCWVRANNDWSFETQRYFGNKGLEIKENRWMSLLPKKKVVKIGPVHVDSSLL